MIRLDVGDGVHLITHAHVNCYVIEDDEGITLVDAGLPTMWPMLLWLLEDRGRAPEDVKALVLTHGHFDHVGFALRAHQEWACLCWSTNRMPTWPRTRTGTSPSGTVSCTPSPAPIPARARRHGRRRGTQGQGRIRDAGAETRYRRAGARAPYGRTHSGSH
jgi:glyoxylase-like metal-dependent hydrolase (beta-lactamase superfamily II)